MKVEIVALLSGLIFGSIVMPYEGMFRRSWRKLKHGVEENSESLKKNVAASVKVEHRQRGMNRAVALQQAQIAFSRNRMAEARTLAEQALHYNKKNAAAWEVMGDVSRNQERNTDALRHYTMASQHDPRRASVQQKIERIARQPVGPQSSAGGYTPNTPNPSS